ncbi:MAG: phosphoserine phosphatase [archaeon]|nr:phosphoserine phosphatase [archaeon]
MVDTKGEVQRSEEPGEVVTETPAGEAVAFGNLVDLEHKRESINDDAERSRKLRDDLNKQTREWIVKRDELNAQVRDLVNEAGKHRKLRDEYNLKVKESKVERDERNKVVASITEQYKDMKKDHPAPDKNQPSIRQLKKEFSDLENKQQIQVLKKKEEEALVKRLKELDTLIKEREKLADFSEGLKGKSSELKEAKTLAEEAHKLVSEYAEKAQSEHDQMILLYEQADALRKQADEAQARFIESKKAADREHKKLIGLIKDYHKTDKYFGDAKDRQRAVRKKKSDAESKKAADNIFARFKSGDKLSTEDLMALQKSGYL